MSYEMIDRYLRNNLGDDDYAEYSAALDALAGVSQPPTECKALAQPEAEAGVSWDGHNVRGDADSIAEVRRLIDFEDARQGTKPATED